LHYLQEHREELLERLRSGRYKPQAVRRVEIPKAGGGTRKLGVPTVIDRMIQQAMVQVLQPIFEKTFSGSSYGFRPKRSAHQAMQQALEYCKAGFTQVVDIDLAKYFDTVNHDILIEMVRAEVSDARVITLMRKYLKSGVMVDGLYHPTEEGTPQGGNLSPLLSNIYLTAFDRMLESRGHKFVRYADDCNIYVKSRRAADRVMESCVKFLGFSLYKVKGKTGIRPHQESLKRFKEKIRELTGRKQARPVEQILNRIKQYTRGWLGYYAIADMTSRIKELNEWTRRRIRQIYWKQWKRISARFENLKKLGIDRGKAWEWANSRLGYWRVSLSWILTRSLTNEYLVSAGYDDISQRYEALHQSY
jgi:RNA-directed DNA polymerase